MKNKKAWVVSANMGYGHHRAAMAVRHLAPGGRVIVANDYAGIPESDKQIWEQSRKLYEIVSRFKRMPVLGDFVFNVFDKIQAIKEFYPRNQGIEPPTMQVKVIYQAIEKKQWGKHLIEKLNKKPLPLLCTFPAPAFMAEHWRYEGPVYLVVTDTDVSRAWAPLQPTKSKIHYLVPTLRAAQRLQGYGISKEYIFCTGFPLPLELLGEKDFSIARQDIKRRLAVLDPQFRYRSLYRETIERYIGVYPLKQPVKQPVTITFAIGGAGAQQEIGENTLRGLIETLKEKKVRLFLLAGVHQGVAKSFLSLVKELRLSSLLGKNLRIIFTKTSKEYFEEFSKLMRITDILWTKPSELVFYAALGIPIILAPPIGSQETFNRKWILRIGAAVDQSNPLAVKEWLFDLLNEGSLAEAAMQGFVEIEKQGAQKIAGVLQDSKEI